MKREIQTLNDIIRHYNQYTDKSLLWHVIKDVLNCSEEEAKERAKEYCNVISFYALCFSVGKLNVTIDEFLENGIMSGDIRKDGFIKADKKKLLNKYGYDLKMNYSERMTDLQDGFYQMKIKSRGGGFHFIACYFKDEKLYLSDTSNRGIGVFAEDVVTKKQFMWLLRIDD